MSDPADIPEREANREPRVHIPALKRAKMNREEANSLAEDLEVKRQEESDQ